QSVIQATDQQDYPSHLKSACPHPGENTMDDDIEKRVLVNKDGSLSMEMKVRFRLLHNETLHWSTEVKKAKSTFNESHTVPDDACSLSHGSAESCSEADSLSAGEADETYSTKHNQRHFEEPHCKHCCAHCKQYDIWKNPVPPDQGSVRCIRSSSSSASSRRIVCKKASTDSIRTMSSEDRSEVPSLSPRTKSTSAVEDKPENSHVSENDENRPDVISSNLPKDQLSVQITQPVEEDERPVSVVSSSSQILASLKEDQDDEDVDLPLSTSRTSHGQQEDEESKDEEPNPCSTTPCKSPASPAHLSPRPPSKASSLGRSKRSRKLVSPEVDDEEGKSEASASPKASYGFKDLVTKDLVSPGDSESNDQLEDIQHKTDVQDEEKEERALSALSAKSKTSVKSLSEFSASCGNENATEHCTGANSEIIEERSSSAISIKSNISGKSNKTNVSEVLEKDGRAPSAMSVSSQKSNKSGKNDISDNSTQKVEDNGPKCHSATSVTSGNHLSPSPLKSPKKSKKPVILLGSSNDSMLSQTGPAPEPKEEYIDHLNAAAKKTQSCRSDTNVSEIKSEKSSKCRKRIGSGSSCLKMDDDTSQLSPSCLPNASPTEVVNEWLKKIPLDTTLCDLGDEFHDNYDSIEPLCTSHVPSGDDNEHGSLQPSDVTKIETQNEMEDAHVVNKEGTNDKKSPEVAEGDHTQRGDEPKMFDSSVLVMKVLLSPKLDRCNSLPEVSSVYGRKLSASAQGLLDCLANLQLLDFGPNTEDGKKEKYQELMSMLKSLWLCDPKDSEKTSGERNKHLDEEFKARSSSGVDVNSGSTGSGKSSDNDGTQAQINTECEVLETLTKVQEVDETVEGKASETPGSKHDSATPDIANQAQLTPETKDTDEGKLKDDVPGSEETIKSNDSPRELIETPLSSNKSSGNNPKKEETESDRQEDTSSGSAPKQQRGQLSKSLSQDPDPVWVLNLLNKLEKQFMTHYVNAMAEFKVRWNLDDNEQLDAMICELQDEVRRRIQSSIDRE
uniref:Retinitis pigmentosa 1-like 1 protein n=1 Tax=Cyprinus carpio TaxID=7962 RepID=A0A8C2AK88_CYPCA